MRRVSDTERRAAFLLYFLVVLVCAAVAYGIGVVHGIAAAIPFDELDDVDDKPE